MGALPQKSINKKIKEKKKIFWVSGKEISKKEKKETTRSTKQ